MVPHGYDHHLLMKHTTYVLPSILRDALLDKLRSSMTVRTIQTLSYRLVEIEPFHSNR